jgi:hypothetical protein
MRVDALWTSEKITDGCVGMLGRQAGRRERRTDYRSDGLNFGFPREAFRKFRNLDPDHKILLQN